MSNPNETLLLGFEIAFSLPDWFPPKSAEYTYTRDKWYSETGNRAVNALHELPGLSTSAVEQICGNWVTFKFEHISPKNIPAKTEECRQLLNAFIKEWCKPITGHEYLIQPQGRMMFEVLDLSDPTPGKVVWVDHTYEKCQAWVDQPVSDVGEEE
jgi:hypothetical protein